MEQWRVRAFDLNLAGFADGADAFAREGVEVGVIPPDLR